VGGEGITGGQPHSSIVIIITTWGHHRHVQVESDALAAREAKLGEDRHRLQAELDELLGRQEERLRAWEARCSEQDALIEQRKQQAEEEEQRLKGVADTLAGRERDLIAQREHLAAEVEAARRAADEAAAERTQLQQRSALLDAEREQFRGWMRDAREETARSIKVSRQGGEDGLRTFSMHRQELSCLPGSHPLLPPTPSTLTLHARTTNRSVRQS